MYWIEAFWLGVIQGLTEFLPVSSSAHLTLVPQMLRWKAPLLNSLSFDVALHVGTLVAVLVYFRSDLFRLSAAVVRGWIRQKPFAEPEARLAWFIILGTLPAVAAALAFGHAVETVFRSPLWVAGWLIGFGFVMAGVERWAIQQNTLDRLRISDSLWIGVAQALALMPGVSRSGATISAGLALGFRRAEAARFSFLLSIPAIMGAAVFEIKKLFGFTGHEAASTLLVGVVASAVAGYGCIKFLLAYFLRGTLYPFVVYRIFLGLAVLAWYYLGAGHSI